MKTNDYTLIDTFKLYTEDLYTKEDYIECYGEEPTSDEEFASWVNNEIEIEIEDFWEDLRQCNLKCDGFIIEGSLGLWNGTREIEQTFAKTLYEAVTRCVGSCDYMEVRKVKNHIEVVGHHHDGSNHFEVYGLSDKGYDIYQRRGKVSTQRGVNILKLPLWLFE